MITDFKDIDKLSPSDFEIFVKELFELSGWSDAVVTKVGKEYAHGDGGVDIFAYKNKRKYAIEVKKRSIETAVNVDALNQLVTGGKLASATHMILVTNSYFSSEVQVRALCLGVELVDREGLQNLFIKRHSEIGREIKPRNYQEDIISECIKKYNEGKSRILIEMATGLGKTYTAAHIIKRILQSSNSKMRILFLAHQVEILLQSATSFKNVFGIGSHSFSACFAGKDPENTDFVFATFDTLYTKICILEKSHFDIVIVDEAHHSPARTYAEVVRYFQPSLLLGLTATPYRVDNKDVLAFFGGAEGHIGKRDLAWALKHNKLAFPKYLVLLDDLDQSRLDQLKKGLSVSDLDKRLFLHKKDEEVVRIIEDTIRDRKISNVKGIVFCQSIKHMKYLIGFFPHGSSTMVHSQMRSDERRENIRDFREGEYRYILVCDLFNEGIDIPETNLLIFMRYTGSRTVWLQQLGRGLRKTPNKEYVYVLDFVGSLERLTEIQELVEDVKNVKIDKEDLEVSSEDDEIIHDSSLIVSYDQSAAQVLNLIEKLQYKLNSREQMIDKMREYVEINGKYPELINIENDLADVTCDQVATHFDSYYRFLEIAVPDFVEAEVLANICLNYAEKFFKKHKVYPSVKAISLSISHNNLVMLSEADVSDLIGEVIAKKYSCNNIIRNQSIEIPERIDVVLRKVDENKNQDMYNISPSSERLIIKYLNKIKISNDIKGLTESEKKEIRTEFRSLFKFMSMINKKNKDEHAEIVIDKKDITILENDKIDENNIGIKNDKEIIWKNFNDDFNPNNSSILTSSEKLIDKYINKLNNSVDIKHLPESEKKEIRKLFHSLFSFLNIVKGKSNHEK